MSYEATRSFLLMVEIKKYYKVTALSIMSKLIKKKKEKLSFLHLFFFFNFHFLQHLRRKRPREVTSGFKLHAPASGHEEANFPFLV